jgi:hypothetical protein
MERHEVRGVKVYQLNICEAIGGHYLCPGITTLKVGDHDLGTVACNCLVISLRTKHPRNDELPVVDGHFVDVSGDRAAGFAGSFDLILHVEGTWFPAEIMRG